MAPEVPAAEPAKEEEAAVDPKARIMPNVSNAKLLKLARREEFRRNHRVLPPGSTWKRRDGTEAHAGPRYGEGTK